jgi:hypothetical protein
MDLRFRLMVTERRMLGARRCSAKTRQAVRQAVFSQGAAWALQRRCLREFWE